MARKIAGLKKTSILFDVFSVVLAERETVIVPLICRMELFVRDDEIVRYGRIERVRLERPVDLGNVEPLGDWHRLFIKRRSADD